MGVWDRTLEQWTLRASSSHCWLDPVSPWCVVCMCGVVKARWCLHCFLIAKMPGLQCLPGAKPPAGTSCCQYKHTQLPLVYKEGWSLVASVQPGHQPKDDYYTQVISSPFQSLVFALTRQCYLLVRENIVSIPFFLFLVFTHFKSGS